MRRTLLYFMFAVMTATAVGQTQQGYVKTRGKLAADGKSVVPGVRLSNALVTIENRSPVKSGENGAFSFALPAGTNRYRLQGAELKGYTLADPDAIRQTHTYSKDLPLIVVLEDMKQREADLEAARKSVRNVMKREIRKKQDELDSLRDAHAITQAKYDSLVRDFWEFRQSSENLVNEMAERYVSTDYDQLDDFNRQVQAYIESGQLTKADSMIRSKGSLEERFNRVKQYESTNAQRETEIHQQQEALDKSRQYTQKEKEDLANDLYRQHLIFLQQPMMQDSALYCLKLRADLDTTSIYWVLDFAELSHKQKHYYTAEKYYQIILRLIIRQYGKYSLSALQHNLGLLYSDLHDYSTSEKYYKLALENLEELYEVNPEAYRVDLARTQYGLGNLYSDLHDYSTSEKYYKLALENFEKLYAINSEAYRVDLARTQNGLSVLYSKLHDYTNSEKYGKLALDNKEILYAFNPEAYRADLASTQHNMGILYSELHDYANSEKYHKLALANIEILFAFNPEAYQADLALEHNSLGSLYKKLGDYANSEKYYKLALENMEKLFPSNPEAYRFDLAGMQYNLGNLYRDLYDYATSEKYYKLALENIEKLYAVNPEAYRVDLARTQSSLSILYSDLHDYTNSEKYSKLALENEERLYAVNPEAYRANLASTQHNMGNLYSDLRDFTKSEKYYKLALGNYEQLYTAYPELFRGILAGTYWNMMLLYAETNKLEQYDTCLTKALDLYRLLYDSYASTYKPYIIELQNRVVWRMLMKEEVDEALTLARNNYTLDKTNETSLYHLAQCYNSKAYQYANVLDFAKAISTIDEAIELMPKESDLYDSKGEILLMQGKDQEALKMWKKVLELNPKFLDEYPEGTSLSKGLKAKGLIK